MSKVKVTLSLEDTILAYIDSVAELMGISRSGAVSVMATDYKKTADSVSSLNQFIEIYEQQKKNSGE